MADYFSDQAEQKIAGDLFDRAINGQSVSDALNSIPLEDRVSIARKMEALSQARKDSQPVLPQLEIEFKKDANGVEHVINMYKDNWGPFNTDVYDMPGNLGVNADTIANTRLEEEFEGINTVGTGPIDTVDEEMERWNRVRESLGLTVSDRLDK